MSSYHLANALCYKIPRLNFKKPICFKIDLALEKGHQSNYENILPPLYIHIGTIHGTGTAYLRFQRGSYCSIISFMWFFSVDHCSSFYPFFCRPLFVFLSFFLSTIVLLFILFSFGHCIVCTSSNYGFLDNPMASSKFSS